MDEIKLELEQLHKKNAKIRKKIQLLEDELTNNREECKKMYNQMQNIKIDLVIPKIFENKILGVTYKYDYYEHDNEMKNFEIIKIYFPNDICAKIKVFCHEDCPSMAYIKFSFNDTYQIAEKINIQLVGCEERLEEILSACKLKRTYANIQELLNLVKSVLTSISIIFSKFSNTNFAVEKSPYLCYWIEY